MNIHYDIIETLAGTVTPKIQAQVEAAYNAAVDAEMLPANMMAHETTPTERDWMEHGGTVAAFVDLFYQIDGRTCETWTAIKAAATDAAIEIAAS